MYPQFCAFAHDIDQKLSHLGASQLAPTGEGDELSGQEDAFRSWAVQTFRVRQACNESMPNTSGPGVLGVMTSAKCRAGVWVWHLRSKLLPQPPPHQEECHSGVLFQVGGDIGSALALTLCLRGSSY